MKTSTAVLVPLLAATGLPPAYGQTTVEMFGQVSTGFYSANHMTAADSTLSGQSDQPKGNNRIGLRVLDRVGNGLQIGLNLESNFSLRTGAFGESSGATGVNRRSLTKEDGKGAIFDREANISLRHADWGALIAGRGPTLQAALNNEFDARKNWNFAGLKPVARYAGFHSATGINIADNLVRYISPKFGGLQVDVAYAFGGTAGDAVANTNTYAGLRYSAGAFDFAYNHIDARLRAPATNPVDVRAVNNRVDFIAAKYKFDALTLNAGYVITRNPSGDFSAGAKFDANTWFTGAVYRITPALSVNAGLYQVNDRTNADGRNDLRMLALGTSYTLTKRTEIFADIARAQRKTGLPSGAAKFTLYDKWQDDGATDSTNSLSQSGVSIGMLHRF